MRNFIPYVTVSDSDFFIRSIIALNRTIYCRIYSEKHYKSAVGIAGQISLVWSVGEFRLTEI